MYHKHCALQRFQSGSAYHLQESCTRAGGGGGAEKQHNFEKLEIYFEIYFIYDVFTP